MLLSEAIGRFLEELRREGVSPHTLRAYGTDLDQMCEYFRRAGEPEIALMDALAIREYLGHLYHCRLKPVSMRRKLAAIRSLFRFLHRRGLVKTNPAKLIRTPKAPRTLPRAPTEEQTNALIDRIAAQPLDAMHTTRDLAIFELLYGSGLRVSELVGLDLEDIDFTERWLRVRGKGNKERIVPYGSRAANALAAYVAGRKSGPLFLNPRGGRLTDRSVRQIVKRYAIALAGDDSLHPHSFRHAFATHLLRDGADLRAIQELLGHARLSTTEKYTQITLQDLIAVYNKAHPKA